MKQSLLFFIIFVGLVSCNAPSPSEETAENTMENLGNTVAYEGIDGSEIGKITAENTIVFSTVTVKTTPSETGVGEDIVVDNFEIKNEDAHFFAGVYKNFLIVDNGTSVNGRMLKIYNLASKSLAFSTSYEGDLKIENDQLTYLSVAKKSQGLEDALKQCKNQSGCESNGLKTEIGLVSYFDFNSKEANITAETKCFCVQ
jgi:hypothetical protein